MNPRSVLLAILVAIGSLVVSPSAAQAFDLSCCCFRDCPEGNAVCFLQYFTSTCEGHEPYCSVSPAEPTTDIGQVHPFWFLYYDGKFSGFSIQCQDIAASRQLGNPAPDGEPTRQAVTAPLVDALAAAVPGMPEAGLLSPLPLDATASACLRVGAAGAAPVKQPPSPEAGEPGAAADDCEPVTRSHSG